MYFFFNLSTISLLHRKHKKFKLQCQVKFKFSDRSLISPSSQTLEDFSLNEGSKKKQTYQQRDNQPDRPAARPIEVQKVDDKNMTIYSDDSRCRSRFYYTRNRQSLVSTSSNSD